MWGSGAAQQRSQGEVRKLWGGWGAHLWIDACWETRWFVTTVVVLAAAGRLCCTHTCTRQAYWNDATHQPKALHHPDVFIFICFRLIYRWMLAIYYIKNGPGLWAIWLFIREDTFPSFLPSSRLSLLTGWTVKQYSGQPQIGYSRGTQVFLRYESRGGLSADPLCISSSIYNAVTMYWNAPLSGCRVMFMELGASCTSFSAKMWGRWFNSAHKNELHLVPLNLFSHLFIHPRSLLQNLNNT